MNDYLTTQIITYMGNKRKLLDKIENVLINLEKKEGKKLSIGDGFSGSGIVSRLFKQHADKLYTNDIADYSETLNKCFLNNISDSEFNQIKKYIDTANRHADKKTNQQPTQPLTALSRAHTSARTQILKFNQAAPN